MVIPYGSLDKKDEEEREYTYKDLPTWRRILEPLERTQFVIQNLSKKAHTDPDMPWSDVLKPATRRSISALVELNMASASTPPS